jgi:hypothetical protein
MRRVHSQHVRSICRRSARRGVAVARGVVRTLLLLSLWHAPIPWIHAHDLEGPQVEQIALLHRHVDACHSREIQHGDRHLDLHSHLVFPWGHQHDPLNLADGEQVPVSEDTDFLSPAAGVSAGTSLKQIGQPAERAFEQLLVADLLLTSHCGGWGSGRVFSLGSGRHFFETFGETVSVCDLVCVRTC